ncbi:EVE domain-containing protein [Candidatus Poriferisodalis sp.]|uniref:EVE domain-containing protein n=1 Tax=Candidatus Poriferisodalis sp. TaxID=3101277 RepID=UPI003B5B86B9
MSGEDELGPTYLLTWNPDDWEMDAEDYDARVLVAHTTLGFINCWSLGTNYRQLQADDAVLLYRHGESAGIIAAGFAVSDPYPGDADGNEIDESSATRYWVQVLWNLWKPLDKSLPIDELIKLAPSTFGSPIRASGRRVHDAEADTLWSAFCA